MAIRLVDKVRCTGCEACCSACPKSAISMVADNEGFYFPFIDDALCVECGACVRSCPVLTGPSDGLSLACYAAKSRDRRVVAASSSGGVFSELASRVLDGGGIVFGAAYDKITLHVSHVGIDSPNQIDRLRGSKYVQSEIGDAYQSVAHALTEKRKVLFSGTPCQIAGLRASLKRDDENLFLVDVICHGVPSVKLFDQLKNELHNAHGKLYDISFRDKSEGWSSREVTGWYKGLGKIREHGRLNDYFRAFIGKLTIRRSCEICRFNAGRSGSDITLGDFWGIGNVCPEFDDDTGVSAVIIHSKKGANAFDALKCLKREVALSDITSSNPSYAAVRRVNPKRSKFMKAVWKVGISRAYIKCERESVMSRITRIVMKFVNKVVI